MKERKRQKSKWCKSSTSARAPTCLSGSEERLLRKTPSLLPLSLFLLLIWYGVESLWIIWVSCPSSFPSHLLVHPHLSGCGRVWLPHSLSSGEREWLEAAQALSAVAKNQCVISTVQAVNPKHRSPETARKEVNSIPARLGTILNTKKLYLTLGNWDGSSWRQGCYWRGTSYVASVSYMPVGSGDPPLGAVRALDEPLVWVSVLLLVVASVVWFWQSFRIHTLQ